MAKLREVKVPDIGDFDAVEIVEVLVAAGDSVDVDQSLITLESDKATMDVPSPAAGTVKDVKVKAGDEVGQGDLILTLEAAEEEEEEAKPQEPEKAEKPAEEREEQTQEPETLTPPAPLSRERERGEEVGEEKEPAEAGAPRSPGREPGAGAETESAGDDGDGDRERPDKTLTPPAPLSRDRERGEEEGESFQLAHASPAVRRFARELGADLPKIEGSGRKGRITREDVQSWVKERLARAETGAPAAAGGPALPPMPDIDFSQFGPVEEVELSRIRKKSASNLHRSWLHVPHVTQLDEADVTDLEDFRKQLNEEGKGNEDAVKMTFLPFLMKACVAALKQYPEVNASLAPGGERLVVKRYYHLGVAVDTDDGLIVPVVRDVDKKGLTELAREVADLASRARSKKLKPDDLQGAGFTISSLGGIGGTAFTPIVNAPEVAILGVSRMKVQPVWIDGGFEPRKILPLSFSYDHRVVDGAMAARFTTYLSKVLTDLKRVLL